MQQYVNVSQNRLDARYIACVDTFYLDFHIRLPAQLGSQLFSRADRYICQHQFLQILRFHDFTRAYLSYTANS